MKERNYGIIFVSISIIILAIQYIYTLIFYSGIDNLIYGDFNVFYTATRQFIEGNLENIYSYEFWGNYSFQYLPGSIFMFLPFGFFNIDSALLFWRLFSFTIACCNRILLYQIFKQKLGDIKKVGVSMIIFSVSFSHIYEIHWSQRDELALFLLLLPIFFELKNKNSMKFQWISSISLNLFITIHPYFIWFYVGYILMNEWNWKNILRHLISFFIVNIYLIILWRDFINGVIGARSVYAPDWWSYSILGVIGIALSISSSVLITISNISMILTVIFLWIYVKPKNISILKWITRSHSKSYGVVEYVIYYVFIMLLFNIMIQDYHLIVMLPFLCIYCMNNIKTIGINLRCIHLLIPLLFMSFPIPSNLLVVIGFGSLMYYKRVLFYPFYIKKKNR